MEKCIITDQVDDDLECALKQIRDKGIHCVEPCNLQFTSPHIPTPLYFPDVLQSAILQMSL